MSDFVVSAVGQLVVATAAIPLEFAPTSTTDAVLYGIDATFDTVFGTTYPYVEVCTYGTVGSGGTTPTPAKLDQSQSATATMVVRANDTTLPTTITRLFGWYWSAAYQYPEGRELKLAASGKYCLRITSPAASFYDLNLLWGE
jgi:hypothetical protein